MNTYWICEEYDIEADTKDKCLESVQERIAENHYNDPNHTHYSRFYLGKQDFVLKQFEVGSDDIISACLAWANCKEYGEYKC